MKAFVAALSVLAVLGLASAGPGEEGQYDYYAHKHYLGNYVPDTRGQYVPDSAASGSSRLTTFGGRAHGPKPHSGAFRFGSGASFPATRTAPIRAHDSVVVSAAAFPHAAPTAFGAGHNAFAASRFGASSFNGAAGRDASSPILKLNSEADTNGYRYAYETGNRIAAEEEGRLGQDTVKAHGFYQYVGPDGQTYRVDYTADENGFVPYGAHLPKSPPIPEAIQRSLDYIARTRRV